MSQENLHQLWSDFLTAWPAERVRQMMLEEYTNPERDDALIYWIEKRTESMGSIWGGSAFKFGIYCRDNTEAKEAGRGRVWGEKYAWLSKYGNTEQEAFATVRSRLIEVLDAVEAGNFARIEEIDLAPVLKWKVAFLYQDRTAPALFPIYKKQALFANYQAIDPGAKLATTPYHVMYETLMERHRGIGDVFEISIELYGRFEAQKTKSPKSWAVPLAWTIQETEAMESLCLKTQVEPEDVDSFLENLLTSADLSEGDRLALLVEGDVRALATLTNAEPGQFAWTQVPVNFPSNLLVIPTSEIRALDASEDQEIWSHLPEPEVPEEESPGLPRYWKIAPGRNGVAWPEWQEKGIAAIGWPELGDLTHITRPEFEKRAAECASEHAYRKGMSQVWTFRSIKPGDGIVANQGTHTVLGIGTVVEGYYFAPGVHEVDGEDYPHQIKVKWQLTDPRKVNQGGWRRTIIELSKDDFEALLSIDEKTRTEPAKPEPPPPPCEPRNVIIYGPPGTGKTYSTVRRALELILGAEKTAEMSDKGLLALFREHQARGQIEFVTFHQAYGYEEFVEGIRPVLSQTANEQVSYEIHNGIFKRIAMRAAAEGLRIESSTPGFDELWDLLVRNLENQESRIERSQRGKTYQLVLSRNSNIQVLPCDVDDEGNVTVVSDKHQVASKENARLYWKHRAELGPEPDKITYEKTAELFSRERGGLGGNHYTALWIVYAQLFALSRTAGARKSELIDPIARVQQVLDKPGPTTTFSFSTQTPQYVLIVDEINRGNISKILGELITLLEPDKRLTAPNELKLPLSYTPQHRFAVPPNLHLLGTMNTADRSIALMDVALRRRFTFEELMPDVEVIRHILRERVADKATVKLAIDLFDILNHRIRFLYDRDHQIGHSYFLNVANVDALRRTFVDRIIPMLQEYFYGAWDKICAVLGCPYNESGEPKRRDPHLLDQTAGNKAYAHPIVTARAFPEVKTLGFDHDDYEDRVDYKVRGAFQKGTLETADLYRTFLGVLAIDGDEFQQRLTEFTQPTDQEPNEGEVL